VVIDGTGSTRFYAMYGTLRDGGRALFVLVWVLPQSELRVVK
jgi:hypothetical protein